MSVEAPPEPAGIVFHPDFASAFDLLSGAVFVALDLRGRIDGINSRGCALLGAREADILGGDFVDISVPPEQGPRAREEFAAVTMLPQGTTHSFELSFRNEGGLPRLISWRCTPRFDAKGDPVGQLCYGEDITERRSNEEDIRQANERLSHAMRLATIGEMASGIAHEINQPLAAIVNYARACEHFLALPVPELADLREAAREIGVEALRAGDIIRRLRHLVRSEGHERTPAAIPEVFDELRLLSQADARAFETQIDFAASAAAPRVHMDRGQITQALLNLIRNALESVSADPPGKRRVAVEQLPGEQDYVEIRVRDNGPGVKPGIIDRMFEPFCTTKTNGAGLGLPMSRTIVQAHRGRLSFEPMQPRGACFTIKLPVAANEAA